MARPAHAASLVASRLVASRLVAALLAAVLSVPAAPAAAGDAIEGMAGPYGERLRYDEKGLSLVFPEPDATLRIAGRLQIDAGAVGLSRPGLPEAFPDNVAVRRAWIEPSLRVGRDWFAQFQYDFNNPTLPIADAYLAWKGWPGTILTLGNMKEPFSLEWLQNNNEILFTERALANTLVPDRRFGFAAGRRGEDWTLVAGVFGGAASDGVTGAGTSVAARGTWAPILREDEVLHLGLAGIHRVRGRGDRDFTLSGRGELFLFARPFVDAGAIPDVSGATRLGAEAAYRFGPFLAQAELIRVDLTRFDGRPGLGFTGGQISGAVVLNGPGRVYALEPPGGGTSFAVFQGVKTPQDLRVSRGGPGVFELAARFAAVDLDDRDVRGGRERDVTVGLNWYPEPNVRVTLDYLHGRVRPGAEADAFGTRPFAFDTVISRLQFYW